MTNSIKEETPLSPSHGITFPWGRCTNDVCSGRGGGGQPISDQRKGGCVNLVLTRGREGVQNPENLADVICACPLASEKSVYANCRSFIRPPTPTIPIPQRRILRTWRRRKHRPRKIPRSASSKQLDDLEPAKLTSEIASSTLACLPLPRIMN